MSGALAVASREIRERRLVFPAALVAGILAVTVPVIPAQGLDRDALGVVASMVAIMFGFGVAVMSGASVFSRDLAERRMSFYFARPLTGFSIWSGKLIAAIIIPVVSVILVLLPASFIGQGLARLFSPSREYFEPIALAGMFGFTLFLIAFSSAASIALRAKSGWILLDKLGFAAAVFLSWYALRPIIKAGALHLGTWMVNALLILLTIGLLIAGAVGITRGRSEIRNVHRWSAITLALILVVGTLVAVVYSIWVQKADLADLRASNIAGVSSNGTAVAIGGVSPGRGDYVTSFITDVQTGKTMRLAAGADPFSIDFSADGKIAFWSQRDRRFEPELRWADLAKPDVIHDPKVSLKSIIDIHPSADGSRVAMLSNAGVVTIHDLRADKALMSAKLGGISTTGRGYTGLVWISDDVVRLYNRGTRSSRSDFSIYEVRISERKAEKTGEFTAMRHHLSPDGALLLASSGVGAGADLTWQHELLDGRTAQRIAVLNRSTGYATSVAFVGDKLAVVARQPASTIEIYDRAGMLLRALPLPEGLFRIAASVSDRELLLQQVSRTDKSLAASNLAVMNIETGAMKSLNQKGHPVAPGNMFEQHRQAGDGALATKLFESDKEIFYLDPHTGQKKVVASSGYFDELTSRPALPGFLTRVFRQQR